MSLKEYPYFTFHLPECIPPLLLARLPHPSLPRFFPGVPPRGRIPLLTRSLLQVQVTHSFYIEVEQPSTYIVHTRTIHILLGTPASGGAAPTLPLPQPSHPLNKTAGS